MKEKTDMTPDVITTSGDGTLTTEDKPKFHGPREAIAAYRRKKVLSGQSGPTYGCEIGPNGWRKLTRKDIYRED